jgi:hypothetical protein
VDRDALAVVPEAAVGVTPCGTALAAAQPHAHLAAFPPLRSRASRISFAGQVASAGRTSLQSSAIGWLVLELTGSPTSSWGLALAAGGVPSLLLGPWDGSIADSVDLTRADRWCHDLPGSPQPLAPPDDLARRLPPRRRREQRPERGAGHRRHADRHSRDEAALRSTPSATRRRSWYPSRSVP